MKRAHHLLAGLTAVCLLTVASLAEAQPGPGMGPGGGAGMGPGAGNAQGGGMGPGRGRGFAFNSGNTRGWALMTAEERTAFRANILAAKSYDECKSIQESQHRAMQDRAKERGVTLPAPRQNACDRMQARGFYK